MWAGGRPAEARMGAALVHVITGRHHFVRSKNWVTSVVSLTHHHFYVVVHQVWIVIHVAKGVVPSAHYGPHPALAVPFRGHAENLRNKKQ